MSDSGVPLNFIDDPHAPETYASGITGLVRTGDNISITFESVRVDHATSPGPVNRVVVHRMILPMSTAQALVLSLNDFLEAQGHSPSKAMKGAQTAQ